MKKFLITLTDEVAEHLTEDRIHSLLVGELDWPSQVLSTNGECDDSSDLVEVTEVDLIEHLTVEPVSVVTTSPVGTSETLTIYPPDAKDEQWTVSGDLREVVNFDHESTNYLVFRHLVADGWSQANLDPEYSCFFGYADTEAEANKLAEDAMRWALKVCNEKGDL